jgi:hypothetical protein
MVTVLDEYDYFLESRGRERGRKRERQREMSELGLDMDEFSGS